MTDALVDCFAAGLQDDDVLVMPEPVYFGGTVDRRSAAVEIVAEIERRGRNAQFPDRSACGRQPGQAGPPVTASWSWEPRRFAFAVAHELLQRLAS